MRIKTFCCELSPASCSRPSELTNFHEFCLFSALSVNWLTPTSSMYCSEHSFLRKPEIHTVCGQRCWFDLSGRHPRPHHFIDKLMNAPLYFWPSVCVCVCLLCRANQNRLRRPTWTVWWALWVTEVDPLAPGTAAWGWKLTVAPTPPHLAPSHPLTRSARRCTCC